ncbi:hypothetical protein FHL15_004952 [Xylaria flabelliformis]|uniref:Uncharacterized protein n=1 Tax=Xylaria flabelliformis TaxID=2512241 RepID=A0A553I1V6_9PEZI|nr:hypothetical protein FHL15_004952 [Xylaria flabelliformis]
MRIAQFLQLLLYPGLPLLWSTAAIKGTGPDKCYYHVCRTLCGTIYPEPLSSRLVTLFTWAALDILSYNTPGAAEAGINAIHVSAGNVGQTVTRAAAVRIAGEQVCTYLLDEPHELRPGIAWNRLGSAMRRILVRCRAINTASIQPFISVPLMQSTRSLRLLARVAKRRTGKGSLSEPDTRLYCATRERARPSESALSSSPGQQSPPVRQWALHGAIKSYRGSSDVLSDGADMIEHQTLGLANIAALSPEIAAGCASVNDMLVVHPAEAESKAQALPLGREDVIIDLTGYVALNMTSSWSDDGAAQEMLVRLQGRLLALARTERSEGVELGD